MKLVRVQVQCFRNILDSTEVVIQDDVTCLVGKNESGKTAFLEALRRLNPAQGNPKFEVGQHYPAWLEKKHRRQGKGLDAVKAVTAWFTLEQADKEALSTRLGEGVFQSDEIAVSRTYGGKYCCNYTVNEALAVKNSISKADLPESAATATGSPSSFVAISEKIADLQVCENAQVAASADGLKTTIDRYLGDNDDFSKLVLEELDRLVPKFFYFAEYSKLSGIVKIRELLAANDDDLDDGNRTAKSLLMQAGAEDDYLLNPKYETRKRELENNGLTGCCGRIRTNDLHVTSLKAKTPRKRNGRWPPIKRNRMGGARDCRTTIPWRRWVPAGTTNNAVSAFAA